MNDKEICELYSSGLTIKEVAEKLNIGYETVRKILKSNKIQFRKKYVSDFTNDQIKEIIVKYQNNETITKIAKEFAISEPAISKILKSHNIEIVNNNKKYDILRQIPFTNKHKQIIVGTLLGDGCLYRDSHKSNYKLSFSHCEAQAQYFHWKIAMMDPFINNFRKSTDKRGNSIMLQTSTITHQEFNQFGNIFYNENRKKILPKNLDMYLTPLALAIWIQDDGNLKSGVNMRIASMNFSEQENYELQKYLKQCFDLNSKVMEFNYKTKKYYQITLNKENTQKLSNIIRPYVVDCMKYKIMSEPSTTTC